MDNYSARRSHVIDNCLRVYHQGGLDTYCGFYAILNLVNFVKFKNERIHDFIGANDFEVFKRFIDTGVFRGFFPERPFGDGGIEAPMLVEALYRALLWSNLRGKITIEENELLDPYNKDNHYTYFRPGTEKPFVPPARSDNVLGLAVVKENRADVIGHWVVFVGKGQLKDTGISCNIKSHGIVLDSERGYKSWRIIKPSEAKRRQILICRDVEERETPIEWIYSFVSLSFD